MRSKKLARQLKKSLDCEEIDGELQALKDWLKAKGGEPDTVPGPLHKLVDNFAAFLDTVDAAYEQYESNLSHAQRSLELSGQELEERNKLLRTENNKVSNLLNNMRQAVFSVTQGGAIAGPVSRYSDTVFGGAITDKSVYDVLYPSMARDSEQFSALQSAIVAVFGESDVQWGLVEDHFPTRAELQDKVLKVACSPIWDDKGLLDKIMYVVEDVTEVEKLEKRVAQEKAQGSRNIQIVQELISGRRQDMIDFLSRTGQALAECAQAVARPAFSADTMSLVTKHLHTIKGNARLLGFSLISGVTHRVEGALVPIQEQLLGSSEGWSRLQTPLGALVEAVRTQLQEYQGLLERIFGTGGEAGGEAAASADSKLSLHDMFDKFFAMVSGIASELGKEVGYSTAGGRDYNVEPEHRQLLQDSLLHLIRNALDHGLETPETRQAAGKIPSGSLRVSAEVTGREVLITVADDGRGIDAEKVAAKALAKACITREELARLDANQKLELIFLPGLSTKDEVSELSGRGVGLDVVRDNIGKLGGNILIETTPGKGTSFRIRLPHG